MKNLGQMMKQAQQIQAKMAAMQDELASTEVSGSSGGGMVEVTLKRNPTGRLTTTRDVAATIAALSQPEIQFISGTTIVVDGGESAVGGFK